MLPVLLVTPIINYTVDPANLFTVQGEEEARIGAALVAGKNVANFERYDDRRIARYLLQNRRDTPDVVVLGSSRTLNMGPYLFPGSHVVNGSMLASTLREVLAGYQIVHSRKMRPHTVIVGIDPWMLNANAYDERWTAIQPQFDSALAAIHIQNWPGQRHPSATQSRLGALVSPDYMQQSLKALASRAADSARWYRSTSTLNKGFTRLPDGSYTYSEYERTKGTSAVDERAMRYTSDKVYMLEPNATIDPTLSAAVKKLLEMIRADGSEPVLFLPPYHPIVYAALSSDPRYSIVTAAEKTLRGRAAALGVTVAGSYDPKRLGLGSADFYDGHHLKESGLMKVFGR